MRKRYSLRCRSKGVFLCAWILLAHACSSGQGGVPDVATDWAVDETVGDPLPDGAPCAAGTERCSESGVHQVCREDGAGWEDSACPTGLACDPATGRCACPAASPTALTGRVLFPNGIHPVAGALVYVPSGPAILPPSGPQCMECVDPSAYAARTETAPDGTFRLEGLAGGDTTLVVEKGYFQRIVRFDVEPCSETAVLEDMTRLPRNRDEGFIPSMAVITGNWDRIEDVIREMGVEDGVFDILPGTLCGDGCAAAADLLTTPAAMMPYHIIFINCGVNYDILEVLADRPDVQNNIFEYVRQGGRLYVTDQSYDFIEQTFPGFIDFAMSESTPVDQPETHGYAQCGYEFSDDGIPIPATVVSADLASWLETIGAGGASISLEGFLQSWAVMDGVSDEERATLWVEGHIPVHDWQCLDGTRPMTLTFDAECGKVLYSSYHTVEGSTGGLPQELILMYLILEISTCLEEIVPLI